MSDTIAFACTVEGMCCAAESVPIERAVRALPGVRQVVADTGLARLSVTYDSAALSPDLIVAQVERLGFRIAPSDQRPTTNDQRRHDHEDQHSGASWAALERLSAFFAQPRNLLTVLCGLLILVAWVGRWLGLPISIVNGLYVLATLLGGVFVARNGWATLRATRTLDINILMTIAAAGALLIGEYAEGAAVVFLFALGNALEGYTMERSRRSIRALMRLAPDTALLLRDGVEREVPAAEVGVGERFVVRPGDRVALDGVVLAGSSAVDQAPITGESVPVEKGPGAELFAGSINGEGALEVRASRPASQSTLARIIHLVEQAQSHKAPTQRFVDRFARYYTPAVILLAAIVAVLPPLVDGNWGSWFYRALALLVIACPCALVISTPVSIVSAISAGARAGVLFKGGASLEAAGSLRALAFDKTGTLTTGRPVVNQIIEIENEKLRIENGSAPDSFSILNSQLSILRLAAAVERRSAHPLARAIVLAAEERGLAPPEASEFRAVNGRGATALVEGRQVTVGNRAMFADIPLSTELVAQLDALERAGNTAMLVGVDGAVRGVIAAADAQRAESGPALAALRRIGIDHIAMLTGDAAPVAKRVAAHIGVDQTRAELLPEQKLAAVDELLARHGRVGMVGDGINDAPALARATVGVAMGAAGSDAALETADITLMADDLRRLPFAIGLSRATRRIIIQNVAFALAIKALFLVATLLGVATLWMAVLADTGAALIVIGNGMRLLRHQVSSVEVSSVT
jgi:Cd2+/Zn2+-exporting ATPase